MAEKPVTTVTTITLFKELVDKITEYQHREGMANRMEAIRVLIRRGLKAEGIIK